MAANAILMGANSDPNSVPVSNMRRPQVMNGNVTIPVGNLRKAKDSQGNVSVFKFVTPVVYKNSFLDLEDDTSEIENLEDALTNDIDKYYENMNEFLGDDWIAIN